MFINTDPFVDTRQIGSWTHMWKVVWHREAWWWSIMLLQSPPFTAPALLFRCAHGAAWKLFWNHQQRTERTYHIFSLSLLSWEEPANGKIQHILPMICSTQAGKTKGKNMWANPRENNQRTVRSRSRLINQRTGI